MHYFLTGEIKVGKSTIIHRFLNATNDSVCGFKTLWIDTGVSNRRALYLTAYRSGETDGVIVARRTEHGMNIYPERFDEMAALLTPTAGARLMIMDELGFMESGAPVFQRAVLACLDKDIPILGVIKPGKTEFLDKVRAHPKVQTIPVAPDNRDAVFHWILEHFKPG